MAALHPLPELAGRDLLVPLAADEVRSALRRGEHAHVPGAVRASFGIGTTRDDVDALCDALTELVERGPRLDYAQDQVTGDFLPLGDTRTCPTFDFLPDLATTSSDAGCGSF
jgi:hypothetical protein